MHVVLLILEQSFLTYSKYKRSQIMLQIFLFGAIPGLMSYLLIECSKKKKVAADSVKKDTTTTLKQNETVKFEKEVPIKLYRNEKINPIPPETHVKNVQILKDECYLIEKYARRDFDDFEIRRGFEYASFYAFNANPTLNRYSKPKCKDSSRVILENRKNDYINASWVVCDHEEYRGKNILTQGPLKETIPDFWAMIYQENVEYIVMFCSFIENGVEQSAQYYPIEEGSEKYDNFEVKHVRKEKDPIEGVTWTVLHLINTTGNDRRPRRVNHINVTWWPEKTTPDDTKLTLELYKWLMKKNQSHIPMVFHCNNGIGRSATFMAIYFFTHIDISTWTFNKYRIADFFVNNYFQALQRYRNGAIESPIQYCFFMCCLYEFYIQEGRYEKTKRTDKLMADYKIYAGKVRDLVNAGEVVTIAKIRRPKRVRDGSWYAPMSDDSLDD
ncbi:unnamed protein product [Caenorhabditis angaria]|uniref:Tyrosine-protein phosphatase domain-containing protein n=1 Tax=Caenorhabditis angaria TaxID=860376 RepID=A0A9P1MUX8_9PELO|nr:unnamed protein product [Caenorhabditis angaria]